MSHLIWNEEDLGRLVGSEDKEVRYWAVDRLVRHYPSRCCGTIAEFLLDEHEVTPTIVARHLGEHGNKEHYPILLRGFRLLRGRMPGLCLQSLARLGYSGVSELAEEGLKGGDLTELSMALIVETLADLNTEDSLKVMRAYLDQHVELMLEPAALRGALKSADTDSLPDVLARLLVALQWRGSQSSAEAFRVLMDSMGIDDAAWCFRTGPSGHIELRKTIKAVESGYDCDIQSAMGEPAIKGIAQKIRLGDVQEVIRSISSWTTQAISKLAEDGDDAFTGNLSSVVEALSADGLLDGRKRYGKVFQESLLIFHLSVAFAVARGVDARTALRGARGDLEALLRLAEVESAHLVGELPQAVAVVCKDDEDRSRAAQDWSLRMLESHGPFFPKVMALEILGELRSVHFIPEVMGYLSDENSYVYAAAERALGKMGEAIVLPAMARIEAELLDPDAAHSLLVLLADLGTYGAYEAVTRHFDWFMDAVGPGTTAEWISLFGVEETIEPLRDWLDEDPAMVGQGLLLLGAIHNVPIPEEEDILEAIEDERRRQAGDVDADGSASGGESDGGSYVM